MYAWCNPTLALTVVKFLIDDVSPTSYMHCASLMCSRAAKSKGVEMCNIIAFKVSCT